MLVYYGNPKEYALIFDPSGLGLYCNLTRHAKSQHKLTGFYLSCHSHGSEKRFPIQ